MNKFITVLLVIILLVACQTNAEKQSAREKALIDSVASVTAIRVVKEFESKNLARPKQSQSTLSNSPNESTKSYNWEGEYSGGDDQVGYSLVINTDAPARWAEYGWALEASGIQTYYKINGYAIRDNHGNLEFHYLENTDGAFFQAEEMNVNATMFKLKKKDNKFTIINGKWKITNFITDLIKK